jgi:SAM-dependent methyltransferase
VAPLSLRDYCTAQNFLVELITKPVAERFRRSGQVNVLDLGTGTANVLVEVMGIAPAVRGIGVDFSPAMLDVAKRKLLQRLGPAREQHWDLICEDIFDVVRRPGGLGALQSSNPGQFDVVITAHTLHHYTPEEKLECYRACRAALADDGLFLQLDLFDYRSQAMSTLAQIDLENGVSAALGNASVELRARLTRLDLEPQQLIEEWVTHFRQWNVPLPVEGEQEGGTRHAGVPGELDLLVQAGFETAACPYRRYQTGILWAEPKA